MMARPRHVPGTRTRWRFNRHLAEEITKHRSDRNKALYFAGREAELGAAHNAFAEARNYSQTVFRVFTGAPGCGKSSLLTHIQEMNAAEPGLLFVDPDEENLHSRAALMDFVADEAIDHLASSTADRKQWAADIAAKHATPLAQSLGEAFRIKTAGEMLSRWQRKRGLDGLVVVIVLRRNAERRREGAEHPLTVAQAGHPWHPVRGLARGPLARQAGAQQGRDLTQGA